MTKCESDIKVVSNKSRTYLLPLLSKQVDIEFDYLLINTFIKFNRSMDITYPIALLYELEDTEAFAEFNFPEQYINEYKLFKEGKYSKFTSQAKSLIISYSAEAYKFPPLIEDITGVLYKHRIRRERMEKSLGMKLPQDSELASRIIYENETFNFID
jgi:hypothetical protein